jgi:hypothetical protein
MIAQMGIDYKWERVIMIYINIKAKRREASGFHQSARPIAVTYNNSRFHDNVKWQKERNLA